MNSNFEIQKICKHCGKEFTAKTTVTRYCSDVCAKRAYKARKKAEKIEKNNQETQKIKNNAIEELKAKEFLTVRETAQLLGFSLRTTYRLINNGTIKAVNISQRMTRIKRSDLDKLMNPKKEPTEEPKVYEIDDCYTLTEVQEKYGISDAALQSLVKRNSIPKFRDGIYAYVPKEIIDQIFNPDIKNGNN